MRTATVICILLLNAPISLSAQRQTEPIVTGEDSLGVARRQVQPRDAGTLFLAGMAGMISGAFGGGFIGSQIDNDTGLDDADGAVIGGLVGTTLLVPITVHLANYNRGDIRRSILVSSLLGGALLGLGVAANSGEIVLAIPFVQLFTAMAIERDTSKPPSE